MCRAGVYPSNPRLSPLLASRFLSLGILVVLAVYLSLGSCNHHAFYLLGHSSCHHLTTSPPHHLTLPRAVDGRPSPAPPHTHCLMAAVVALASELPCQMCLLHVSRMAMETAWMGTDDKPSALPCISVRALGYCRVAFSTSRAVLPGEGRHVKPF